MAYTIFLVPSAKRAELDEILREDRIARQSHKLREASTVGGPAGEYCIQIEGAADVVGEAEQRLAVIGSAPSAAEKERIHQAFVAEDEAASAGMGLFFTEG